MAHHGYDAFDMNEDQRKKFNLEMNQEKQSFRAPQSLSEMLGATGRFPYGKLTKSDEGEIMIAMREHEGKVIIEFGGKPVQWFGLTKEQAIDFAKSICKFAGVAMTVEI